MNNAVELTKPTGGCLLKFNKETGKITVNKKNYETDSPSIIPELQNIKFNFNGV